MCRMSNFTTRLYESASLLLQGLVLLIGEVFFSNASLIAAEPIPEKLVVLTFDDSVRSHFTVVRPILLNYGFSATFFITEGFDFKENKRDYMTWDEIAQLHRDGFEIGNHTRDHLGINDDNLGYSRTVVETDRVAKNGVGLECC